MANGEAGHPDRTRPPGHPPRHPIFDQEAPVSMTTPQGGNNSESGVMRIKRKAVAGAGKAPTNDSEPEETTSDDETTEGAKPAKSGGAKSTGAKAGGGKSTPAKAAA